MLSNLAVIFFYSIILIRYSVEYTLIDLANTNRPKCIAPDYASPAPQKNDYDCLKKNSSEIARRVRLLIKS